MISSDKQLSPNQVVDISGFVQGARLPSNTNIHEVFGNCGQIQSIHHSIAHNNRHIFVVFDTIGAARAALQLKHESWEILPLIRASEEVLDEFNKCIARSGWQSRSHDSDFGNGRSIPPEDRVVDLSADERYIGDNGWSSRRRPSEAPMDYERPGSGQGPLPPQAYRGPSDPSFTDSTRGRGDIPPRDSLDGPRTRTGRSPISSDFRRPLSPTPSRQAPPDPARYGNASIAPGTRRGPSIDYPPSSYGPSDRPQAPRDARGPYADDRYRREVSPPPQWSDNRRRPYEDSAIELEASNKRLRLNEGGEPVRSRPRDYSPVDSATAYRGAPLDPSYRQPPPRGPPDTYPPPPPVQYRSRTMDDQYPASSARYGRDEPPRYRSGDDYDGQYRRVAGGAPYSTPSVDSGPGYRSSATAAYPGYSSPDSMSSRAKPLTPVGRTPGPPVDYPATYRVDDRRNLTDYRQPEEFSRRFVEPAPPSRMPRQEDPRRGYMDSYPPPAVDDRRYDSRRYDARLSDGMVDRDYDRRGPPQYPTTTLPPAARAPSPPRLSLASRLGMEPRGSAMDAPSGPRYRGSNDYDPMMTDAPPTGPSYRDDYRRLDEPRDRERFDDQRATPRAGFDLRDRLGYDSRDRERGREAERDRDRARDRERDREYPDDRYRRDSSSNQARPFDRSPGTRVGGIHPADGTVIFVSNLPAQVSQPRFRRLFADAVSSDNVMDVNTGRAGFAFVRIRTRELAEEAVSKLHHVEFAPKFKMNVSIGKPPHEYRKWKNGGYHSSKRSIDNRPGPPGPGQGPESPAQPKQNPNKKKKKNKKHNHGPAQAEGDKEKLDDRAEGEGGNDDDSGDESGPGSDPDGTDIRHGGSGGMQMTQEEIEAFMENAAKEVIGDHSKDTESASENSGGAHANDERRFNNLAYSDPQMKHDAYEYSRDSAEESYRRGYDIDKADPYSERRPDDSASLDSRTATNEPTGHRSSDLKARNDMVDADADDAAVAEQLADLEARSAPSEA